MTRRIVCALTIALAATRPGVAADETRITNASNVRLRTAPATDELNTGIAKSLNGAMDDLLKFPAILAEFDPKTRCGELHASLDPLTAAVTASTSTKKMEALAALERYTKLCK